MSSASLAPATPSHPSAAAPILGLRENWAQFALLVLVSAFVGAMVGIERSVVPLLAVRDFGLASATAMASFVATFGIVKAATNLIAGRMGDRFGRKRVLVVGWLFALPVPLLVITAPSWGWIIAANVLLGVNQGLTWSTTVIMKIDLVGPKRRGLAMGLNEFAGYVAVAASALGTGLLAQRYGLRPEPFYLGVVVAVLGLAISVLFVRDTSAHARVEAKRVSTSPDAHVASAGGVGESSTFQQVFALVSWRDGRLFNVSQAGLVNNLNDGLAWSLFPIFFATGGLSVREIGILAFVYPATWGTMQLATGALSDRWGRKWLIAGGMLVQGVALASMVAFTGFAPWLLAGVLLGVGTAMVYPTLLAAIGDVAHPSWRGSAVGVYRLWRDLGYAVGALTAGMLADVSSMGVAILTIAVVTVASGVLVGITMPETHSTILVTPSR